MSAGAEVKVIPKKSKSSYTQVDSGLGIIAHNFIYDEAKGKVLIEKSERIVAEIDLAHGVSFSPNGRYLLISEVSMDDDQRYFLIDLSQNKLVIPEPNKRKRLGTRWTVKSMWSPDSKSLTFFDTPELGSTPQVVQVKNNLQ